MFQYLHHLQLVLISFRFCGHKSWRNMDILLFKQFVKRNIQTIELYLIKTVPQRNSCLRTDKQRLLLLFFLLPPFVESKTYLQYRHRHIIVRICLYDLDFRRTFWNYPLAPFRGARTAMEICSSRSECFIDSFQL